MAKKRKMPKNDTTRLKTIRQKEKELFSNSVVLAIGICVIAAYICLQCGAWNARHHGPNLTIMDAMKGGTEMAVKDPLYFTREGFSGLKDGLTAALTVDFFIIMFSILFYTNDKLRLKHDQNTLKGSSKWANIQEMVNKYAEFEGDDYKHAFYNAILSDRFQMSMNMKHHFHALNTLIVGATGSGKSRYYLKPNLLQMNCSYVITDPSGGILQSCGEALRRFGYKVRVIDLVEMGKCDTYNPMNYCYKESDVKKLVQAFIKNTSPPGESSSSKDPFWDDAMNAFLCACISLLVWYGDDPDIMGGMVYDACFANVCELTRMANKTKKDARTPKVYKSPDAVPDAGMGMGKQKAMNNSASESDLNIIFENLRTKYCSDPTAQKPYALREWENFKIAPEKTSTTILMTAAVRLDPFNIQQVRNLTCNSEESEPGSGIFTHDSIHLETFGNAKDALFVITPTNDRTYNFLAAFLYTQLFDILYTHGEKDSLGTIDLKFPNGELVRHFSRDEVNAGIDAKEAAIKNPHLEHVTVTGKYHVTAKKGKKKPAVSELDDGYYEILDADGELISRRPTRELADQYVHALKNGMKRVKGNGESVPNHVRFLLDEFPNLGEIPEFKEKLATMRKYEISCTVICQSITQLKGLYEKDYEVIDANCPQTIFLGGDENTNNEYVSKKLGKATVRGGGLSTSAKQTTGNVNIEEKDLLRPEELGRIPFEDMLIMIYGEQPIYDRKYDYPAHKNYRFTYDFAKENGCPDANMFDKESYPDITDAEIIHIFIGVEEPVMTPTVSQGTVEAFRAAFSARTPRRMEDDFMASNNWVQGSTVVA